MELLDSEAKLDRLSVAHFPDLMVVWIETSSEEEKMALNLRRSLRDLVVGRKGSSSKDAPNTQLPLNPPFPPFPSALGLHLDLNLQKKKRKGKEIEEGEIATPKESKQQKINKGRQRETLVENKEDSLGAEVHRL